VVGNAKVERATADIGAHALRAARYIGRGQGFAYLLALIAVANATGRTTEATAAVDGVTCGAHANGVFIGRACGGHASLVAATVRRCRTTVGAAVDGVAVGARVSGRRR